MMDRNIVCPYCGGTAIFRFQRDARIFDNHSFYIAVNDTRCYEEQPKRESYPDIDILHCGTCNHFFEKDLPAPALTEAFIPVKRAKERLENVREVRDYNLREYKQMVISAQGKVAGASLKAMATRIPSVFEEIQEKYRKMCELDAQVDLLEYLIQKDSVIPSVPSASENPEPISSHSDAEHCVESAVSVKGGGAK